MLPIKRLLYRNVYDECNKLINTASIEAIQLGAVALICVALFVPWITSPAAIKNMTVIDESYDSRF